MKKHIIAIAVLLCGFFAAQGQTQLFHGYANIASRSVVSTGVYDVTLSGFTGGYKTYPDANWEASDIPITPTDYVMWGNCVRFQVLSRVSVSPLILRVQDHGLTGALVGTDLVGYRVALGQETSLGTYRIGFMPPSADGNAGAFPGVSPADAACIGNYYKVQADSAILVAGVAKNITTGTLAAATATRTIPMGGQDLIIDNADDIRLKATGEYYIGSGGGDAPTLDSDNGGFDLGYGSSNEIVLHQRAADQVLSKAGAPVDGTDVAWYVGQLLVNTSTGDIYRASSKSTNPDFAGTGSVWVQVGGTGGSVSDSPVMDTITKNSHGFLVGQPVAFVGGVLVGAQATTPVIAQAVVTKVISVNVVEIGYRGSFTATAHGFSVDSSYFTPTTAGVAVINASKPVKAQFLFRVKDANTLIVSVGEMFDGSMGSAYAKADSVTVLRTDINNLQVLSGRVDGSTNMGTYTGVTIPDNQTIKQNIQSLETSVESSVRPWSSLTTYATGDVVSHSGDIYKSLVSSNVGKTPSFHQEAWRKVNKLARKNLLLILNGQSLIAGDALNSAASVGELTPSNTYILNQTKLKFEPLVIGTNNLGLSASKHGYELSLAAQFKKLTDYENLYIVKYGIGSTTIQNWSPGGAYYSNLVSYIKNGVNELIDSGVDFDTYYVWSQGDANCLIGQDTIDFRAAYLPTWKYALDTMISEKMPIIVPSIYQTSTTDLKSGINRAYSDFSRVSENLKYVVTSDTMTSQHPDYTTYFAMTRRMLNKINETEPYVFKNRFNVSKRKQIRVTGQTIGACSSGSYSLAVTYSYNNPSDSIIITLNGAQIDAYLPATKSGSVTRTMTVTCSSFASRTVKIYFKNATYVYDVLRFIEDGTYTGSIDYGALSTYSGLPTTDATRFTNWVGSHSIFSYSSDTLVSVSGTTPVSTPLYGIPGFAFSEIPTNATKILLKFKVRYNTAGGASYLFVRANSGASGPTAYVIRLANAGLVVSEANGSAMGQNQNIIWFRDASKNIASGSLYDVEVRVVNNTIDVRINGNQCVYDFYSNLQTAGTVLWSENGLGVSGISSFSAQWRTD